VSINVCFVHSPPSRSRHRSFSSSEDSSSSSSDDDTSSFSSSSTTTSSSSEDERRHRKTCHKRDLEIKQAKELAPYFYLLLYNCIGAEKPNPLEIQRDMEGNMVKETMKTSQLPAG